MDPANQAVRDALNELSRIQTIFEHETDGHQLLTTLADLREVRKQLDTAIRLAAARLARTHGLRPRAIADALDVDKSTVTRWISATKH
ncbi:hypothetical protein Mycsm_07021 (plasmid) [Mycobacterium sp. JS623]|uniref:helix-turn-helix domain-containing protein n=1 Tax=Mycobacterium sp. JS623 TaxID=212767 RepID=UPI0002A59CA7|nr:helix-turn-helix domain-containing protein [Mycobacterium sp. JS623]AGB27121.1 hypothetical protein Mycsm_07021 [Mycobacterium sp. JS623]